MFETSWKNSLVIWCLAKSAFQKRKSRYSTFFSQLWYLAPPVKRTKRNAEWGVTETWYIVWFRFSTSRTWPRCRAIWPPRFPDSSSTVEPVQYWHEKVGGRGFSMVKAFPHTVACELRVYGVGDIYSLWRSYNGAIGRLNHWKGTYEHEKWFSSLISLILLLIFFRQTHVEEKTRSLALRVASFSLRANFFEDR